MRLLSGLLLIGSVALGWAQSVAIESKSALGVPVKVITANLNDKKVKVSGVMTRQTGRPESVYSLLAKAQPTAAVCGTYFCKKTKMPIGDIVIGGNLAHYGGRGTSMGITRDNKVVFLRAPQFRRQDWRDYDYLVAAGPRLITDGKAYVDARSEGFRDPRIYSPAPRTAVGVTKHNKLIVAVTRKPITLTKMAQVMKALGAVNAIALDGGGSSTLYYRKKMVITPSRPLTNLLVVYEAPEVYDRVKGRLGPDNQIAKR